MVPPLAVGLVLLTWMLAFGLSRNPDQIRSVLVGHRAPVFSLPAIQQDRTVRLADLRGQVVVINFWGSWCADCVTEHPALAAAWRRYRDQGVTLLGVPWEDSTAPEEAFLRTYGGSWPQLFDPGDRVSIAYGVRGVPETFLVDRSGRIVAQRSGPVNYEWLSAEISRLLGSLG